MRSRSLSAKYAGFKIGDPTASMDGLTDGNEMTAAQKQHDDKEAGSLGKPAKPASQTSRTRSLSWMDPNFYLPAEMGISSWGIDPQDVAQEGKKEEEGEKDEVVTDNLSSRPASRGTSPNTSYTADATDAVDPETSVDTNFLTDLFTNTDLFNTSSMSMSMSSLLEQSPPSLQSQSELRSQSESSLSSTELPFTPWILLATSFDSLESQRVEEESHGVEDVSARLSHSPNLAKSANPADAASAGGSAGPVSLDVMSNATDPVFHMVDIFRADGILTPWFSTKLPPAKLDSESRRKAGARIAAASARTARKQLSQYPKLDEPRWVEW